MNFKIIDPETWTAFLLGGSPDGGGSDVGLVQAGITMKGEEISEC